MGQYSEGGRVVIWDATSYDNAILATPATWLQSAELASLIATGGHAGTVTVGDIIEGFVIGAQITDNANWTFEAQIYDSTIGDFASVYAANGTQLTPVTSTVDTTAQYYAIGRSHQQFFPFLVMPRMRFVAYGNIDPGAAVISASVAITRAMTI